MSQIILRVTFCIPNLLYVLSDILQVYISERCSGNRLILVILYSLGINQLKPLLKVQFLALITDAEIHLVRLVGDNPRGWKDMHPQDVIRIAVAIVHIEDSILHVNGWNAKIKRNPKQFIQVLLKCINSSYRPIVFNAHSEVPAISIRHGDNWG